MIHVEGIGKRYKLGNTIRHDTLRDLIMYRLTGKSVRQPVEDIDYFWALRDLSFDVAEGEVMGIIGKNGAGKSTLLKILSRITPPTEGHIRLKGRVASLLEVGTGFHPELSGRENIYMNGSILGMSRQEIRSKFDEIVDFSGVEKFLETPVKRYSSGMYVRLAFAVAAHLEPEVLVVDEVLAVGDIEFQKKCLGKMGEVARGGRTVLFVSHNMGAVQQLTTRCLVLSNGSVHQIGGVAECIQSYLDLFDQQHVRMIDDQKQVEITKLIWERDKHAPGFNQPLLFQIEVKVFQTIECPSIGLGIKNSLGARIATAMKAFGRLKPGNYQMKVCLINHRFPPGHYSVDVGLDVNGRGALYEQNAINFSLSPDGISDKFLAFRGDKLGVYLESTVELDPDKSL